MLIVVGEENDASTEEARDWVLFARRFMSPSSYHIGARVADTLGVEATRALEQLLRRTAARAGGRDAFACVEAADILRGEVDANANEADR